MINAQKKIPIGVFSGVFLIIGLAIHFWPKPACDVLTGNFSSGFFMRWQSPTLIIVRSNKEQVIINAESKELACKQALIQFNESK